MKNIHEWNPTKLLQSPIFKPLHPILACLEDSDFPSLEFCNILLAKIQPPIRVQQGFPLSFVQQKQGKLSFESQYEPRCYLNGEVQMRANNWHDMLNALVWLTFPKSKAAINARHYLALTTENNDISKNQRGKVRDMTTLFDESGVIVVCSISKLRLLLQDFQWKELFWRQRNLVQTAMDFYLFGHGMYEKALQPYIGMTGQGLILAVEQDFFSWPIKLRLANLDNMVANYIESLDNCCDTHELSPVPLLGVPGWSMNNNCETYYDNTRYFRPGRRNAKVKISSSC